MHPYLYKYPFNSVVITEKWRACRGADRPAVRPNWCTLASWLQRTRPQAAEELRGTNRTHRGCPGISKPSWTGRGRPRVSAVSRTGADIVQTAVQQKKSNAESSHVQRSCLIDTAPYYKCHTPSKTHTDKRTNGQREKRQMPGIEFGALILKMRHLVAIILMIFLIIN